MSRAAQPCYGCPAMRIWLVLAVALGVCAYLGYRVLALEQQVDALGARLGAPAELADRAPQGRDAGHEQRLDALQEELRALRADLRTLEEATADMAGVDLNDPKADQHILSVIDRKQSRIRDRHLEFQRDRWLEWRQTALDDFAQKQSLSSWQAEQLHQLLADEIDMLVEILRRPESAENPERASHEWLDRLEATDRAAHRVLQPAQVTAWDTARAVERRVFWPWLPQR